MAYVEGFGASLYYGNAGGSASTPIANVKTVDPGELDVADIDTTNHSSANHTTEHAPGLINANEGTFTILFDKTVAATLYGLVRTDKAWKVQTSDGSKLEGDGYINKIGLEIPIDDMVMTNISIQWKTKPTFSAGT